MPSRLVTSEDLENELGYPLETFAKASGVKKRYYATQNETSSEMGMIAAEQALKTAGIGKSEIDAIISVVEYLNRLFRPMLH